MSHYVTWAIRICFSSSSVNNVHVRLELVGNHVKTISNIPIFTKLYSDRYALGTQVGYCTYRYVRLKIDDYVSILPTLIE